MLKSIADMTSGGARPGMNACARDDVRTARNESLARGG